MKLNQSGKVTKVTKGYSTTI